MHPDPRATIVAIAIGLSILVVMLVPIAIALLITNLWRAWRSARRRNHLQRTGGYIR